jgi:tat pathway signal sequence domain protein
VKLPFGAKSLCFDEREEHPLFSYPYPAVLGNVKTKRNMQQVIEFENSAKQQPIDVRATIQRKIKSLNLWLDSKSEFYSRICEFSVTRRLVIRVNLVSLCVIVAAVAIEQQPITSVVSTLCAGWLVYRTNKTDKKGGEK